MNFIIGLFNDDVESSGTELTPPSLDHTPSRHRPTYQQGFHPYQRDWSFHRPVPDFSCAPGYNGGSPSNSLRDDNVESLLESQKSMMKAQKELVTMVKDISERVGNLEKVISSKSSPDCIEKKKLPPQLSVSLHMT